MSPSPSTVNYVATRRVWNYEAGNIERLCVILKEVMMSIPYQVMSSYFGFARKFSFHQMLHTHVSFESGAIGQLVSDVRSGLHHTMWLKKEQGEPNLIKTKFN
jgi:hypothetical protein